MHVAPAYADRFCLVGEDAAEREAVIQMQEDSQFFCLAQCQKVIDVERVLSQMVLPGSCQHPWLQRMYWVREQVQSQMGRVRQR